jgi:hypothetical protein
MNGRACQNAPGIRRSVLERQVLAALGSSLMRPDMVAAFCDAFIAEWNRMAAEVSSGAPARQDELKAVERKIANLVEAIEDGLADPGVKQRLEKRRARLRGLLGQENPRVPPPPALHPDLAQVYPSRVRHKPMRVPASISIHNTNASAEMPRRLQFWDPATHPPSARRRIPPGPLPARRKDIPPGGQVASPA